MPPKKNHKKTSSDPFDNPKYNVYFDQYYVPLCKYCLKFTANSELTEDIVQEAFIYLWEHWNKLSEIESLKSYLYTMVKSRAINSLRKSDFARNSFELDEAFEREDGNEMPDPQELLECKELELILERALESLPEKCRKIFVLKRFAGLSNQEIAIELAISIKTVEAQMTIAIKKIKSFVSSHWSVIASLAFASSLFFL